MPKYGPFCPDPYMAHVKMIDLVGKDKKVLEVGCATGYISEQLKKNGCYVHGVEIDEKAANKALRHCDEVTIGDVENMKEYPFKDEQFDVILFGDVLEHLKNPSSVLKKLRLHLKDNGYIVVSVPNVAYWSIRLNLLLGRFEYQSSGGILDISHLRFFTLKTIKEILAETGFECVSIDITSGSVPIPFLHRFKCFSYLEYQISKLWKSLFGIQFLIRAKKT